MELCSALPSHSAPSSLVGVASPVLQSDTVVRSRSRHVSQSRALLYPPAVSLLRWLLLLLLLLWWWLLLLSELLWWLLWLLPLLLASRSRCLLDTEELATGEERWSAPCLSCTHTPVTLCCPATRCHSPESSCYFYHSEV